MPEDGFLSVCKAIRAGLCLERPSLAPLILGWNLFHQAMLTASIELGADMVSNRHDRALHDTNEEIVETGDIFFVYRPKVSEPEAEGLQDVQRFYMILKPEGGAPFRLAVLGRKRLPDPEGHERIWGFIDTVAKSGSQIGDELKAQDDGTRTRGEGTIPPARPAGEGTYALLQRGRSLHLTYELELPEEPREVQSEFNILPQGAYILSIKNPDAASPRRAGLPEKEEAEYPKGLQQEFGGRRFASEDPHLLDYEGAEFILIGARTNPERAYDIDIKAEQETAQSADIFRKLKMSRGEQPLEPLLEGKWK